MRYKVLTLVLVSMFVTGALAVVPILPILSTDTPPTLTDMPIESIPEDIEPMIDNAVAQDNPYFSPDQDIGEVLGDRNNTYKTNYEPWKSKAAIHAIAFDEDTGLLALGGGYLYDNEVHIFRLNTITNSFDKVWDAGDGIFKSDVMSLAIGDTDMNDFMEIIVGCSDGHVYVLEQRHLYDPYANTENQFDHVWTSPSMFRVFDLEVEDIDRDYRPDIIAGGWDGQVHIFEYSNHSGYPFVEEHWITYDEVATLDVDGKIYSVEAGDTNANGLPEVVVGTREGRIYVFENDGVTIWINGYPFPLIYDNHYYLNWTSENYTWTPILSMDIGELDGTDGDELAIVAQGQGIFTLDWNSGTKTYDYQKVYRDYEEWETFGLWGLDFWADSVVEANNVTYHDPVNGSIVVPEPIDYVWGGSYFLPNASVYPYNTGMAMYTDGNYSTFDASLPGVDNATAVVDFGKDEEGTGSANNAPDVIITFRNSLTSEVLTHFNFSVSQDANSFEQVSSDHFSISGKELRIDVDTALSRRKWDWFRYVKLSVFNDSSYEINSLELNQVYNTLTDALSVSIDQLRFDADAYLSGENELDKILVGTVVGEFQAIGWNDFDNRYELLWESGDDDFYTFDANVWAMEHIPLDPNTPTWSLEVGNYMQPQPATTYNSWSTAILDPSPDGYNTPSYLMGTKEGKVYAYRQNPSTPPQETPITLDTEMQPYVESINTWLSGMWPYTSAEGAELDEGSGNPPMIAVGVYNPDAPLESSGSLARARVVFFWRDDLISPFNNVLELWEIDETGELSQLIDLAQTTPKMDFVDFDGDGDQDFVLGNGKIYMAKNLQEEKGYLQFSHVRGYFDEINSIETNVIWGQPDMADLDADGDLDLVLSYGNRKGATSFFNEGDNENPIWVEDKRVFSNPDEETNMKYLNLTDVRIVPVYGGYIEGFSLERHYEYYGKDFQANYTMASYKVDMNGLYWCAPRFDTTDTWIVASYPKVAQMEFSLLEWSPAPNLYFNLGYHIHESWSNEEDLADWTLCIASGDTDNDGNGEMIVGDYDNNVYVFEHLTNNTYKRMFRSFDLNHTEESDTSPYYYEELEGISGDFKRKIWDHAEHLIGDVDLDQDGLKEIVVAAHLQIYIFEEMNLTGGDALRFAYSFDLRESGWEIRPEFDHVKGITAMAAGSDVDYDERKELAVAAGPFLFIYNVDKHSFAGVEENGFFMSSPVLEGRYYLVGNAIVGTNEYAQINAITLCDTDKDGYREVIIGGIEDTRLIRENGFVYIYECQGGTFVKAWEAPEEVTTWNPISVLMLDDQDYDGEQEIIIGHTHGFDMWEHVAGTDSTYQKVEYVTASPNYPIVSQSSVFYPVELYRGTYRYHCDIAHNTGDFDHIMSMVYSNDSNLAIKHYHKINAFWTGGENISQYFDYGGLDIVLEKHPSIAIDPVTNDWYFAWEAESDSGVHYLAWTYYDFDSPSWSPVTLMQDHFTGSRFHPSIFELNGTHMGIAYAYTDFISPAGSVSSRIFPKESPSAYTYEAINFANRGDLQINDVDAVKLHNGDIAIAMAAKNPVLGKPDHDIWVAIGNNQMNFTGRFAYQATTSYHEEMYPSIDYLRSDNKTIVVIYEALDEPFEDRIKVVASRTNATTWNIPESMNTIPSYVERFEEAYGYVSYWEGMSRVYAPMAYTPTIIGLDHGGFMYVNTFTRGMMYKASDKLWALRQIPDLVYGINPQSDWSGNVLRDVIDLDVGDTDNDERREVIVGFHNQVGVYEMKSTTNGSAFMSYKEAWVSKEYENPVTGVTVYDSNNNGWEDIGISTQRGDVYFIEYPDTSKSPVELMGSTINWTTSTSGFGMFASWDSIHPYDIDGDGREEVVCMQFAAPEVFALDDDGSVLWNFTEGEDAFYHSVLADLDQDTIPEVIVASIHGTLHVLDMGTGSEKWNYTNPTTAVYAIDVDDIDDDGEPEVVFGTEGGDIWILHANGSLYNRWTLPSVQVYQVLIGNFTGGSYLDVAYALSDGSVNVLNPLNGTILYAGSASSTSLGGRMASHDFNNDGIEDLVYGKNRAHILDVTTKTVFYNSTDWNTVWGFYVEDFDNDNVTEILGYANEGDIYLVEPQSDTLQWHYAPGDPDFVLFDIRTGHLGGSGKLDIVAGFTRESTIDDGIAVVIDSKTGLPIWFNYTGGYLQTMGAADIHGTGMDSIIAWDRKNSQIIAIDSYERIFPEEEEEIFPMHEIYWNESISEFNIGRTEVSDLNGDSIDEVIVWDVNETIAILNGTNGAVIWAVHMDTQVSDVSIGDLDGDSWLDIAATGKNHKVYALSGASGTIFGSVSAPSGWKVLDAFVGEFNAGNANDELAVGYKTMGEAFVAWYDDSVSELYRTDFNASGGVGAMAVGYLLGLSTLDVVIGGSNELATVYRGYDGQRQWTYGTGGPTIDDLLVAEFTGDSYEDIALKTSSQNIRIIDGSSHGLIHTIVPANSLRDYYAVDIHLNDGIMEIVLNVEELGVQAFNSTGAVLWQYHMPLTLNAWYCTCAFEDMNGDGYTDVIITNREYIAVIDSTTSELLWHYSIRDYRILKPQVGYLIPSSSSPDIVSYWDEFIYVIAGMENPPMPPQPKHPSSLNPLSISEKLIGFSIAFMPIALVAAAVIIQENRQKKRRFER